MIRASNPRTKKPIRMLNDGKSKINLKMGIKFLNEDVVLASHSKFRNSDIIILLLLLLLLLFFFFKYKFFFHG